MSEKFYIKRGDTSPAIMYELPKDMNLAFAEVKIKMRNRRTKEMKIDRSAASIANTTPAIVYYDWTEADTDTAGIYDAEFEITYVDNTVETVPNNEYIVVVITEDLR